MFSKKNQDATVVTRTMHLLDSTGDTAVATWDPADTMSVAEAKAKFDELIREGYFATDATDPVDPVVTRVFDPEAEKIIIRRQMAGG